MNGRHITWQYHTLISSSELDDLEHLKKTLSSPAIEVALTKVIEGGVAGYYEQFRKVVVPILNEDPGCDGHFISPLIENPQDQLLLINWKSVDVSPLFPSSPIIQDAYFSASRGILMFIGTSRGI